MSTPTQTPSAKIDFRLAALRRFAFAITLFNVLGHAWFGFEQSLAQPLASLAAAYGTELLLEWLSARSEGRAPRFRGGGLALVNFLLSAHITGLAVAMLLYANDRLLPIMFAASVAIGSKYLFRAPVGGRRGSGQRPALRHYMNPSNFGISVTLLTFHWVAIAPPYMFTENLHGAADWILPAVIVCSGGFLNTRFTRRIPLLASWVGAFVVQALLRHWLLGAALGGALMPVTGVAFLLFTFYMVTDPGTTPLAKRGQVLFGASVAAVYGLLMVMHVVFTLFFALTLVCFARGAALHLAALRVRRAEERSAGERFAEGRAGAPVAASGAVGRAAP
jgi:hypothetical protein